jgi:hypothetical protein
VLLSLWGDDELLVVLLDDIRRYYHEIIKYVLLDEGHLLVDMIDEFHEVCI